ncbi:MAG: ribonuclease, partial [Balneolaceae bacterium]
MPGQKKVKKIFVLDTSVLLYDSDAVKNFEKHDIAIPITVLEEIDSFKKGNTVTNLHAREFIRFLDKITDSNMIQEWIPLNGRTRGKIRVVSDEGSKVNANDVFGSVKNDHRILNSALKLMEEEPDKKVTLVTKDINLRLKARALNLVAEDYETIRIKDIDHLYRGKTDLKFEDNAPINQLYKEGKISQSKLEDSKPISNHYYILKNHSSSALGYYNPRSKKVELVKPLNAYGISPKNAEQTFAMHALMNP